LIRAAQHAFHQDSEADLIDSILRDTVAVLDARLGAVVLADAENKLQLCASLGDPGGRPHFSRALAERCFGSGESALLGSNDSESSDELMASVLCILLGTAHRRVGVIQLSRGFRSMPFTEDDLYLADALAGYLSLGIECIRLNQKQRTQ